MIASWLMALAVLAAVVVVWRRRRRRSTLRWAASRRAGASAEHAIAVRRFSEIDEHLADRWCHCGGYLERAGEGSREVGGRRFRIARLRCQECEEAAEVFFDTTDVVH
jgi:hypothetical protein